MTVDQAGFTAALLDPDAAIPDGLVDPEGRPAGKRFNVYRNNVIVSLMDAMETAFPVIGRLIGSENFRNLSRIFVRAHPPTSPILMFYGDEFPAFLDRFEPLAHLPYLPDVARLELARRESYHAADSTAAPADALGALPPDQVMVARFDLSPALRIVASPHPIVGIWHFNMTDGAPKPVAQPETALVARPELDVTMRAIDPGTATFVQALAQGQTLGDAFEAATEHDDTFDLSAALGVLLELDLITNIKSGGDTQ